MKRVFFALLLLSSTSTLFAQGFQLGIKAGTNVSNFMGGNFSTVDKKAMVGFHAGAFLGFMFGNVFSLDPEVQFSSEGANLKNAGNNENFKLYYINVPVMAKFRFPGGFYLEAGPQVGFKTGENVPNTTIGTFAKNLDLAAAAGLGYHSSMGLGIGARYIAGLSKVGDFDAAEGIDPDFKNSTVQVSLFYTLFNNKK
jgi:hypothetical protein